MNEQQFKNRFFLAIESGKKRNYPKAIEILEELLLDDSSIQDDTTLSHPEILLFLGRSWHSLHNYSTAKQYFTIYLRHCPKDGAGWFFLARTNLAQDNLNNAFYSIRKSLSLEPLSGSAWGLYGEICLKQHRPTLSRVAFEKALERNPESDEFQKGYYNALFLNAIKCLKQEEFDLARQMLTFLINNDMDGVLPRVYLGHAMRAEGYIEEALSQYEAACTIEPDDTNLPWYCVSILLELNRPEEAYKKLENLQIPTVLRDELNNVKKAEIKWTEKNVDLMLIRQNLMDEHFPQAVRGASLYLRKYGSDPVIHCLMGEALRGTGSFDTALNHFIRATDLDRTNPSAHYGIMMVQMDLKDWEALDSELARSRKAKCDPATIDYYQCICDGRLQKDPEELLPRVQAFIREKGADPYLMQILADQYIRIEMPELAVNWYKKVIEMMPSFEEASIGLISAYEKTNKPKELKKAYSSYLKQWGDNQEIRQDFVKFLANSENWEEAADQLEILSSGGQTSKTFTTRQIALYRRKAGQYRQSAILYRAILRENPKDTGALANLVYCMDRMGKPEDAARLIIAANKVIKPTVDFLLIEGLTLHHSGKLEESLDVFRKATDLFPNDWRTWDNVSKIYAEQGINEMALQYEQEAKYRRTQQKVKK